MKRSILWSKWKNRLLSVDNEGNENGESSKMILRQTPFGVETLKLNPEAPELKYYQGETNFDIDESVRDIIEDTSGVEILDILTCLTFKVKIGRNFNHKKVRKEITAKLCNPPPKRYIFDPEIEANIVRDSYMLEQKGTPWIMYILPNGKYEVVTAKTQEEFDQKLSAYEEVKDSIGGIIMSS